MAQQLLNLCSEFWHVWPPALSCWKHIPSMSRKSTYHPCRVLIISFLILISSVSFVQFVFWRSSRGCSSIEGIILLRLMRVMKSLRAIRMVRSLHIFRGLRGMAAYEAPHFGSMDGRFTYIFHHLPTCTIDIYI